MRSNILFKILNNEQKSNKPIKTLRVIQYKYRIRRKRAEKLAQMQTSGTQGASRS
jgi:hypothetical protein